MPRIRIVADRPTAMGSSPVAAGFVALDGYVPDAVAAIFVARYWRNADWRIERRDLDEPRLVAELVKLPGLGEESARALILAGVFDPHVLAAVAANPADRKRLAEQIPGVTEAKLSAWAAEISGAAGKPRSRRKPAAGETGGD
jgi:hypothetical protein